MNIKAEDDDHKQQTSRIQYPSYALETVVIALIFKTRTENEIQHKLSETEAEGIVQAHRRKVVLCRYNAHAAEDKSRRNGCIRICEFTEHDLPPVIDEVKYKRKGKRNDGIPHILREDRKVLIVRHCRQKCEHNRRHYCQQIVREYHGHNTQEHIKVHALERCVTENGCALCNQQKR